MNSRIAPHPENAPGDFYVERDCCIACEAPYHEAPELMRGPGSSEDNCGCYFRRQPSSPDEIERACDAVMVSCVEAVRYAGKDPAILSRLYDRGAYSSVDSVQSDTESRTCEYVRRRYRYASRHGIHWAYTCEDDERHSVVACCFGPYPHTLAVFRLDKQSNAIDAIENDAGYRLKFDHFKRLRKRFLWWLRSSRQ